MDCTITAIQPVLMVRDIRRACRFFERLGFARSFVDDEAEPRYAGVTRDGLSLHLQWHDPSEWTHPVDRPTYRFVVDDVHRLHAHFVAAGVTEIGPPGQTPWGTEEFHVRDPDGNGLQFYRSLT